jgi:2,5-diketo-D-gluconate reductase A
MTGLTATRPAAQVVLSWHLALGNFPIPKSVSARRIHENARAGELHLRGEDLAALSALDAPEGGSDLIPSAWT